MTESYDYAKLIKELGDVLTDLPAEPSKPNGYSTRMRRKLRKLTNLVRDRLDTVSEVLDDIKQPEFVFDPSDPRRVGELIATNMRGQKRIPLGNLERFWGAGVYAIYYNGDFDAYRPLKGTNHPIYVGKANPEDAHANTPEEQGPTLADRLLEHAGNIALAANLRIEDFSCRYLVTRSAWQTAAEDHLIKTYLPIWNKETRICFGLGKHGDKADTRANKRSPWDTLHPARKWAVDSPDNRRSVTEIKAAIAEHFRLNPPLIG